MFHLNRESWFNLGTANQITAAIKARNIYLSLVSAGWDATLAKFKPKPEVKKASATVGEVIAAAAKLANVKPRTLAQYTTSLRHIAADIAGVVAGKENSPDNRNGKSRDIRFAYRSPAFTEWRAKVDSVALSLLTNDAIAEWSARRVAVKKNPQESKSAKISTDSIIRSAKGLFGRKLASLIAKTVELPAPLPFAGLQLKKSTQRFRADVSATWLFAQARNDLEESRPEQFKALTLCLLAGLRRAEADCLTWDQVELENARLSIRSTPYFSPKSEEADREIDLSPEAIDLLRRFKSMPNPDPVFVLKGGPAKPGLRFQYYRADCPPHRTWKQLSGWLASKGVSSSKPIHSLRKQAGSIIYANYGIEAARTFLGHTDIATTSASYLEKHPRVTVTLSTEKNELAAEEKTQGD